MRGEYCIAGASVFSFISVVLMVFALIGQINTGSLPKSIYMAEVNVAAFGAGYQAADGTAAALYMTNASSPLGKSTGLRQFYRWGFFDSCAYIDGDNGLCNSTSFAHEYQPYATIRSDIPVKFAATTDKIIPDSASGFTSNGYNGTLSKAAFWLIFVGACAAGVALIVGVIPSRLTFLVAAVAATVSALGLLIGAAMWTALITRTNDINDVAVKGKQLIGIVVNPGPALYLVWVAFAFSALAVAPYVISFCTYRRY